MSNDVLNICILVVLLFTFCGHEYQNMLFQTNKYLANHGIHMLLSRKIKKNGKKQNFDIQAAIT